MRFKVVVLVVGGVTLSQQLLPVLDLLQEELLHSFSIFQVWELQDKQHQSTGSRFPNQTGSPHPTPQQNLSDVYEDKGAGLTLARPALSLAAFCFLRPATKHRTSHHPPPGWNHQTEATGSAGIWFGGPGHMVVFGTRWNRLRSVNNSIISCWQDPRLLCNSFLTESTRT